MEDGVWHTDGRRWLSANMNSKHPARRRNRNCVFLLTQSLCQGRTAQQFSGKKCAFPQLLETGAPQV